MKRYKYLIFLVLASLVITGCTGGGGSPGYGGIEGYVRYAGTNVPVANALVEIGNRFDYTDTDGFFRVTNLPARTYTLTIEHPGIRDRVHGQTVTIPAGGTNRLTVLVQPKETSPTTGDVGGWVYVPTGSQAMALEEVEPMILNQATAPGNYEPLVGATVRVGNRTMSTRNDGGFYFSDIQPGSWLLTVDHDWLRFRIEREVDVVSGRVTWVGDRESGTIVGGIGYYVVIGINDYAYEPYLLDGPVEDARAVYKTLFEGNELAGLGELLLNSDASRSNIRYWIEEAARQAKSSDDYLVIYFSGNTGVDFLSPWDDDGTFTESRIITDVELEKWVRGFSGNVTLIIDGAHSATMADGNPFRPFVLRSDKNYTVLAGAQDGQMVTYDPLFGNSVFTHFLLEGITTKRADRYSRYGDITARELYEYTKAEMYSYFNGNKDYDYHVPYLFEGQYGDTVIYRY